MSAPKSILLDNDFLSDVRVLALFRKYGEAGICRYVHLLTRLNDERGEMSKSLAVLLGHAIGVADAAWCEFLSDCNGLELIEDDGVTIRIDRLKHDSKNVEQKRKRWRDRQNKKRGVTRDTTVTGGVTSEEETEPEGEEETEDLNKKKEPADPDGLVLLTEAEAGRLIGKFGRECFEYLVSSAADYAKSKPREFRKLKDHAAFIRNQVRFKREQGREFFMHPKNGPGFYPQWEIDKLKRA